MCFAEMNWIRYHAMEHPLTRHAIGLGDEAINVESALVDESRID
jgi:hypothetical protein